MLQNKKQNISTLIYASLSINILSLALPIVTLHFYDRIMPSHNLSTMFVLVSIAVVAITFELILKLIRSHMILWSSAFFEHSTLCKMVTHFTNADLAKLEHKGHGEYLQKMLSVNKLKDFYSGHLVQNYIDTAFVIIFVWLIYYLSQELVLVPITLLSVFVITLLIFGVKFRKTLIEKEANDNNRYDFIVESLRGIHTVKSLGLEPVFSRRYENIEGKFTVSNYQSSLYSSISGVYNSLFNQLMIVSTVFFGALMTLNGKLLWVL